MDSAQLAPITHDEPRLVVETGLDARIAAVIEPVLNGSGYRLVRVRMSGMNGLTLQIMAERLDGTMNVEDCEFVSRTLSPLLDVEDVIERAYHLEVSSAGIDRPLVRKSDFAKWRGHIVKVETSRMVDGRKRFRGTIIETGPDTFTLERDVPAINEATIAELPYDGLVDARLILTDELIQASLKAAKQHASTEEADGFDSDEDTGADAPSKDT